MSPSALPPALPPDTFLLLRFLLTATLLVYLPLLGIVIAGSASSLVLNFSGRDRRDPDALRLSREWIHAVTPRSWVLPVAVLFPFPFFAWVLLEILGSPTAFLPPAALPVLLGTLLAGCLLLFVYRRDILRTVEEPPCASFLAGIAGLLALVHGAFLLFLLLGVLVAPAKIPMARSNPVFLLSWNSFIAFFLFLGMSFGLAGGIALRRPGLREEHGGAEPAGYADRVRTAGTAAAAAGTLAVPAFVVLFMFTFPITGLSTEVFAMAAIVPMLALGVLALLFRVPSGKGTLLGDRVTSLFILMFLAVVLCYQVGVANAYQGLSAPPGPLAAAAKEQPAAKGKAAPKPAAGAAADLEKGKKVFDTVCSACHRFDVKVVGPPLNEVVPTFKGDLAKLKAFIAKPTKVNPAYPAMPPPAIKEDEVDAVARYLLATVKGGK